MQGLADGYFVIPATIASHLAGRVLEDVNTDHDAFAEAEANARGRAEALMAIDGSRSVDSMHRELGNIVWNYSRHGAHRRGPDRRHRQDS